MQYEDPDPSDVERAAEILSSLPTVTEAVPEHDRVELETNVGSHRSPSFLRDNGKKVYEETGCIITGVRKQHGEGDVLAVWLDKPVSEDEDDESMVPDDVDVFSFLAGVFVANVMNYDEPTKNVEFGDTDEMYPETVDRADVDADEIVEELKEQQNADSPLVYEYERKPVSTDEAMEHLDPQFDTGAVVHCSSRDDASLWVYAPDTSDSEIDMPYGWEISAHGSGGIGFQQK